MNTTNLDKYIKFHALSQIKDKKLIVGSPLGLDYTKVTKEDEHIKCVEMSFLMLNDDIDISIEIVPDHASHFNFLKIKYKWKGYEEFDDEDCESCDVCGQMLNEHEDNEFCTIEEIK